MEGKQNLYYALGILAYAVAKADGVIQEEEGKLLREIVRSETNHNMDFQYAEIIFQLLEKDNAGLDRVYEWALGEINKGRHHLTSEIKTKMIDVLYRIADAFEYITEEEEIIIHRFEKDLKSLGTSGFLKSSK